jgi:hypothetical protein
LFHHGTPPAHFNKIVATGAFAAFLPRKMTVKQAKPAIRRQTTSFSGMLF